MAKPNLRIIGDVHNIIYRPRRSKTRTYPNMAKAAKYSLQVGDMSFAYNQLTGQKLNPKYHKFFGGNHDNYDTYYSSPHQIGDYGERLHGGLKFYFVRGAFSIDWKARVKHEYRTGIKTLWEEEQLSEEVLYKVLTEYSKLKPKVMITHSAPQEITSLVGKPGALLSFGFNPDTFTTRTQQALQSMFDAHKPDLWIFGHFHRNWVEEIKGTKFICLDELSYIDFDESGNLVQEGPR
jgi:hypothetical protein